MRIDRKETENNFKDSMRSMTASLIRFIDKVSETDRKILYDALIGKFYNTYQLCNKDLNKFALLLRKGVYPYKYMDSWKRFHTLTANYEYSRTDTENLPLTIVMELS